MKLFTASTLVILFLTSARGVSAQDRENSLRGGAWAIQFAITGDFTLGEFAGGVSLKRQFSSKSAVRIGLEGRGATSTQEFSDSPFQAEVNGYGVTFASFYQRYINPSAEANFYWGVGPLVGYDRTTRESRDDSVKVTSEDTSTALGLAGIVGIEWFATRVISFHAEYDATATFRREEEVNRLERTGFPTDEESRTREVWGFNSSNVRFGLSVYF